MFCFYLLERIYNLLININTKHSCCANNCREDYQFVLSAVNFGYVHYTDFSLRKLVIRSSVVHLSAFSLGLKLVDGCSGMGFLFDLYFFILILLWIKILCCLFCGLIWEQSWQLDVKLKCFRHLLLTCRSFRVWIFCAMTNNFFSRSILWERILYWCFLILAIFYSQKQDKRQIIYHQFIMFVTKAIIIKIIF